MKISTGLSYTAILPQRATKCTQYTLIFMSASLCIAINLCASTKCTIENKIVVRREQATKVQYSRTQTRIQFIGSVIGTTFHIFFSVAYQFHYKCLSSLRLPYTGFMCVYNILFDMEWSYTPVHCGLNLAFNKNTRHIV